MVHQTRNTFSTKYTGCGVIGSVLLGSITVLQGDIRLIKSHASAHWLPALFLFASE
ncbi:hypothetical protein ACNKHV_21860 [Shigella flexneri]